jgi:hypothetical protein
MKDKTNPSVYGIGYIGIGTYKRHIGTKGTKEYKTWQGMLERCYSDKLQAKYPTYQGCSVDKRWHNFQVFAKWFENNYVGGWELDKDILIKGNKIYSPETCCFVPHEVNILFIKRDKLRGNLPIGVIKKGDKFASRLSIKSIKEYLGTFNTSEEAFQAYKIAKELRIKELANKYKDQITEACYQALINYKIEITD